jgi:hypothetical protein
VSRAILREIFDESAYQRFLDRSRLESSPHAYAIFQQEKASQIPKTKMLLRAKSQELRADS